MALTTTKNVELFANGQRMCSTCRTAKPLSDFYQRNGRGDGYSAWSWRCKQCAQVAHKAYAAQPQAQQKARERGLLSRYGLTLEQYNDLFAAQSGCCAICGKHQSEQAKTLAVDHDHTTGRSRGLLCHRCNVGIANLDEDPGTLAAALAYLRGDSK